MGKSLCSYKGFIVFMSNSTFLIRQSKSCVGTYVLTMAAEGIIRNFQIQPVRMHHKAKSLTGRMFGSKKVIYSELKVIKCDLLMCNVNGLSAVLAKSPVKLSCYAVHKPGAVCVTVTLFVASHWQCINACTVQNR